MSTQPNLDFYAHVPTRHEVASARLAEQRSSMYAWRSDAHQSVFDPTTGARLPLQHIYDPQPTQHHGIERGDAQHHCGNIYVHDASHRQAQSRSGGCLSSPCEDLSDTYSAATEEEEAEGSDEASEVIWASAADDSGDRRRWWRQSNFTFSPHHFGTRSGCAVGSNTSTTAATTAGAYSVTSPSVYTPYIHDTILFCTPTQRARPCSSQVLLAVTCNAAEARARELQAAEEAKNGEMLSLSSLSPVPRMPTSAGTSSRRTPYTLAPSPKHCFDDTAVFRRLSGEGVYNSGSGGTTEGVVARSTGAAAAAPAAPQGSIVGPPYAAVDGAVRPSTGSLDDEISTPGDAKLRSATEEHKRESDLLRSSQSTWCEMIGPALASKQRALTMAGRVYRDLVAREARRTGTTAGSAASLRMSTVPTCEVAYSLRSSYLQAAQPTMRNSSKGSRTRSSGGTSRNAGTSEERSKALLCSATYANARSLPRKTGGASSGAMSCNNSHGPSSLYAEPPSHDNNSSDSSPLQQKRRQRPLSRLPQRPASANTAPSSSSGMLSGSLNDKEPCRRTVTAIDINGLVGTSFLEEADEKGEVSPPLPRRKNENEDGVAAPIPMNDGAVRTHHTSPAHASRLPAVAVSGHGVLRLSPLTQQPDTTALWHHSVTNSSEAERLVTNVASPLGAEDHRPSSSDLTAPPTLSQVALEIEMESANEGNGDPLSSDRHRPHPRQHQHQQMEGSDAWVHHVTHLNSPLAVQGRRGGHCCTGSSKSDLTNEHSTQRTDSTLPTAMATQSTAAQTVMGDSQQMTPPHPPARPRRRGGRGALPQQRTKSQRASRHHTGQGLRSMSTRSRRASPQHEAKQRQQQQVEGSQIAGHLPAEAKETRVYAVRMRTTFTNADASLVKWVEPPRRGVPVLLPQDWQ